MSDEAMRDELERLRRWKAEALVVLKDWDRVFDLVHAIDPAPPSTSRADHVYTVIARMRAEQ